MDVYITLDFFFHNYDDPTSTDRELWVCVQPHIRMTTPADVSAWLRSAQDGTTHRYEFLDQSPGTAAIPGNELVPITLAGNVDLGIAFVDAASHATAGPFRNRRTAGMTIVEGKERDFDAWNRPADDVASPRFQGSDRLPVESGHFAATYASALVALDKAAAADGSHAHVAQYLRLGFWGGTMRRLPRGAVSGLDFDHDTHWMKLRTEHRPELGIQDADVTNHHSMCGLMFRIARGDEDRRVATTADITVDLGAQKLVLSRDASAPLRDSVIALLQSLATPAAADRSIDLGWDASYNRRAYVNDASVPFGKTTQAAPSGATLYRRRSTDAGDAAHYGFDAIRTITVSVKDDGTMPVPADPSATLKAFAAFDVTISPYAGPVAASPLAPPAGSSATLLTIRPTSGSATTFYAELEHYRRGDEFVLPGTELTFSGTTLALVGIYEFPWDAAARTVTFLAFGVPPPGGISVALFGRDAQLPSALPVGPAVWRATQTPKPASPVLSFNALTCSIADPRVAIAAAFGDDVTFELGQSAAHVEAHVTASFTHPDLPTLASAFTVAGELAHDVVNYNALNVYRNVNGVAVELTEHVEVFPYAKASGTDAAYDFVYRKRLDATVPPPVADPAATAAKPYAAPFFDRVYGDAARAGTDRARQLLVDVEHTYGVTIPQQPKAPTGFPAVPAPHGGLDTVLDFSVANAAAVGVPRQGKKSAAQPWFLRVAYEYAAGSETAVLTFHTAFLDKTCYGTELGTVHVEAWRAVAELAYAQQIRLGVRAFRYDGTKAPQRPLDAAQAGCLVPVTDGDANVDVTTLLRGACGAWLRAGTAGDGVDDVRIPVPLTDLRPLFGGNTIGDVSRVIEFRLVVTREPDRIPLSDASAYGFYRHGDASQPGVDPFEPLLDAANDPRLSTVRRRFAQWSADLAVSAVTAVHPDFATQAIADATALIVQSFGDTGTVNDDGSPVEQRAWIVPELHGAPAPKESASFDTVVCPIGFTPFANDPAFGDRTFSVVARYFQALAAVIRGDVKERGSLDAAGWRSYFDQLVAAYAAAGGLKAVQAAAVATTLPTAGSGVAKPVGELASLFAGGSAATWVAHTLLTSPDVFADARSLVLSWYGGTLGAGIADAATVPLALTAVRTVRSTVDPAATAGKPELDLANREAHTVAGREMLRLADARGLCAMETLDETRYADAFWNREVGALSYEDVLASVAPPGVRYPLRLPALTPGAVVIPDASAPQRVALTAREAVSPPLHLYTGIIPKCQNESTMPHEGSAVDLRQLLAGALKEPSGSGAVRLVKTKPRTTTATPIDQTWMSALFLIRGDEDARSAAHWSDSFGDDTFTVGFATAPYNPPPEPKSNVSDRAKLFLDELKKNVDPRSIAGLAPHVVDPSVTRSIAALIKTPPPAPAQTTSQPRGTFKIVNSGGEFKFDEASFDGAVYLFHDDGNPPGQVLVLVCLAVPIWAPCGISVQQKRNVDENHVFADAFRSASDFVTDHHLHQPTKVFSFVQPAKAGSLLER